MQGSLDKLRGEPGDPVSYHLRVGGAEIDLNALLGQPVVLRFEGEIRCIACGRVTRRSHRQGYCYPCSRRLARCDLCIVRPELCHFDAGTCREPEWGREHCMRGHLVYLANASGLKVGITRGGREQRRWIDQGAVQGIALLRVRTRYLAGLVEAALRRHVSDRTDWRRMLSGTPPLVDLQAHGRQLLYQAAAELERIRAEHGDDALRPAQGAVHRIAYPVEEYPQRVRSLDLEREGAICSTLRGIKGQYLILADGVLNVRKFTGYCVTARACRHRG
ncbi:MAG TPA: DUF2797 domain-containing protein [Gammaproteobacteria bacterium]|nr:DUF2797 domain-containing protein [Gammaproteobacteria bacterium]